MSISSKVREQIINSFHAELAEHVQTLNNGLLTLEQQEVSDDRRKEVLAESFRAAHSLKGAARAVGVSAIEQLAHALEDILGALQQERIVPSAAMYTACYQAIDAIQVVQTAYEAGETTPPIEALTAVANLAPILNTKKSKTAAHQSPPKAQTAEHAEANETTPRVVQASEASGEVTPGAGSTMEEPVPSTVAAPGQNGEQTNSSTKQASLSDETIRVSSSKLDALMAQLSELLVTKIHAEQRLTQVRQAQTNMADWQREWMNARSSFSFLTRQVQEINTSEDARHRRSENDTQGLHNEVNRMFERSRGKKELSRLLEYVDDSQERLHKMSILINDLTRQYSSDTMQMSLVIDRLEEEIKRVRMLPLATITGTFGRMMRDMAQVSGKEVHFEILGGDVELDKRILEQVKDPLIHMLRNAVDHGIESPDVRRAAGKPASGSVILEARQIGKDVTICVKDDGAGLNIPAIRKAALRRNYPNANIMSEAELTDLIYTSGFSTSPMITDLSGRGIGLDVVRRNIEVLGGRIQIDWKPGAGTSFTLVLPLALTSSRALFVRVSNQRFAIPLNAIERIENVRMAEISQVGGYDTLQYEGRPLMLVRLCDVLNLPFTPPPDPNGGVPVVILVSGERRMAFAVDKLADEQEVVMKGLGRQLLHVGGIAGGSVMGNGEVILILNVPDLMKLALRGSQRSLLENNDALDTGANPAQPRHRILVVDDSITTRTLEKNILEAAGYDVQIATDGLEALNLVSAGDLPELIVSDIAMPRLDGFDLAVRIKGDNRTAHIPFILVTSLDSPEDKARGVDVGADAYIVKSSFDQNNLLETIQQLIL